MSRAALVELYEATNGTGWKEADRANWLTGEPCADAWEEPARPLAECPHCRTVTRLAECSPRPPS